MSQIEISQAELLAFISDEREQVINPSDILLYDIIQERTASGARIGIAKLALGKRPVQPRRYEEVLDHHRELAEERGFGRQFGEDMFCGLIHPLTVRREKEIIAKLRKENS